MFSIKEEKELFFPNHSWSDFQRLYVNKLRLVTDAFDNWLNSNNASSSVGADILRNIVSTQKRVNEIDTRIAFSIVVDNFEIL